MASRNREAEGTTHTGISACLESVGIGTTTGEDVLFLVFENAALGQTRICLDRHDAMELLSCLNNIKKDDPAFFANEC